MFIHKDGDLWGASPACSRASACLGASQQEADSKCPAGAVCQKGACTWAATQTAACGGGYLQGEAESAGEDVVGHGHSASEDAATVAIGQWMLGETQDGGFGVSFQKQLKVCLY